MINDLSILTSPKSGLPFEKTGGGSICFANGENYPIHSGIPVLINEEDSLFTIKDILSDTPTTQLAEYNNAKNWKNFMRRKLLPALSNDKGMIDRYKALAAKLHGEKVLILGTGKKVLFYKSIFSNCEVITSDVHSQFNPDIVFDAHSIPFKDDTFGLVLAGQVLEHCMRPWIVANEMQRVVKLNGLIHIEVPFNFPYHAAPYDFFRFTFTGLRSLFVMSKVDDYFVTEGNASTAGTFNANMLINFFKRPVLRSTALAAGRILFGWLKYLDRGGNKNQLTLNKLAMPKGIGMTFIFDAKKRTDADLLAEYFEVKNK